MVHEHSHKHPSSTSSSQQVQKRKKTDRSSLNLQLKTIDRVLGWPVIGTAWKSSHHVYDKIKGANVLISYAFEFGETVGQKIAKISMPIVLTFETPINVIDNTLYLGLKKLEQKAPIVNKGPEEILNDTKILVMSVVQPPLNRAANIVQFSKVKTNEVLTTHYGKWAIEKFDVITERADQLIDYLLKPGKGEAKINIIKTAASDDAVRHVIESVGSIMTKFTRRVFVILHI